MNDIIPQYREFIAMMALLAFMSAIAGTGLLWIAFLRAAIKFGREEQRRR